MKYLFKLLLITLFFTSCKKENQDAANSYSYNKSYSIPTSPEALRKNDTSILGIYKGVVISTQDSLGTFKLNANNNNDGVYSLFYANNLIKDSLIRYGENISDLQSPGNVDNSIIDVKNGISANFYSYRHVSDPSVIFIVNPTGSAVMNTKLYKSNATSAVLKESSTNQVFCYEGEYSGTDFSKIAFAVSASTVVNVGSSFKNNVAFKNTSSVNISGGKFVLPGQILNIGQVTFTGIYNASMLSGTWVSNAAPSIINSFSAKRTL